MDYTFILDLLFNFVSAYETGYGMIEFRLSRIAVHYIRSWFFLDLCACFPF